MEVSALKRGSFAMEDFPFLDVLSVLERFPLHGVSVLKRFHCTSCSLNVLFAVMPIIWTKYISFWMCFYWERIDVLNFL